MRSSRVFQEKTNQGVFVGLLLTRVLMADELLTMHKSPKAFPFMVDAIAIPSDY